MLPFRRRAATPVAERAAISSHTTIYFRYAAAVTLRHAAIRFAAADTPYAMLRHVACFDAIRDADAAITPPCCYFMPMLPCQYASCRY